MSLERKSYPTPSTMGVFSTFNADGSVAVGPSSHKLVLLGNTAVGKSSLALRFVKNQFYDYNESTIGAAFMTQTLILPENKRVIKFEIWDTAGQERYRALAPMYYRGASAAIVVYDVTDKDSFVKAKSWVDVLQNQCPDIIIALVSNKHDLEKSIHQVDSEEANLYAAQNNLLFFETSAKSGKNVKELFQSIAVRFPTPSQQPPKKNVVIEQDIQKQRSCCK